MFLKSLELRGFKSFADKTDLEFKKGVTAVVGPNGSGKSNISDAVRWVLGEQSIKSLRGGKMEDVIFAGTQYRKPVGLAQVSLTLDNSYQELPLEYSDITISRKIFRSGESEYSINNSKCRLKDITNLFMDTGIGKEGYSIIGQGKIDAILNGKVEDRRSLLEEAAGIVKFKSRKEEAEKRLKNTEQNLIRIDDIISTYEERLGPLKIENEKAKEFLKFSNELKEKEISILVHKIEENNKELNSQEEIICSIKIRNNKLLEELQNKKSVLKNKEDELEKNEKNSNQEKANYYKSKEDSKELSSEIELLTERIKNIEDTLEKNNIVALELSEKLKKLNDYKKTLNLELEERQKIQKDLNEEINEYENENKEISTLIGNLVDNLKLLIEEKNKDLKNSTEINNNLILVNNQIATANNNLKILKKSHKNAEDLIKINVSTKEMVLNKSVESKNHILKLEETIGKKRKEISNINTNIIDIEKKLKVLTIKSNKLEAKKSILINLEKQHEGYTKSVKYLMDHLEKKNILVSDCKVLGDVISVEKKLETAIEISLGGAISNVITENELDAKKLINYLKENKLGRATFLPLNIIKSKKLSLDNRVKSKEGYIGIASELLKYNEKYKKAIESILGRTIICESMDVALEIAKEINYSYKIVTLNGEVVNPGGALTGGSTYQKNTGIISRKREIEEIDLSLNEINIEIDGIESKYSKEKENLKKIEDELLKYKDKIQDLKVEIATFENEARNIKKDTLRIKNTLKIGYNEIISNEEKIKKLTYILKENEEIKAQLNENYKEKEKEILNFENQIKDLNEKIVLDRNLLIEKRILKAQADEVLLNKASETKRIELEIEEKAQKLISISNLKNEFKENIISWKSNIERNKENIKKLAKNIIFLENKFIDADLKRTKIKEEFKILNAAIEDLLVQSRRIEEEVYKKELVKTRKQGERDNYFQRLNEEYNITFAEAKGLAFNIKNEETIIREVSILKGKINKLGNVNVSAIDEYKDVSEKYNFMFTQREDLSKSKDELLEVISEMTFKMKGLFKDNFKVLNKYFNETFRELFKGGSAELILGDGDELTANIDINVQPPGKKVQNINLMSGGEKVLSAIALLFGILKMKPTPFCILDEIEAALDDANVYRYAEFLKSFSNKIQFIVITHRKGTMEASDVMYGVTMEEKGISKVVSVNLDK